MNKRGIVVPPPVRLDGNAFQIGGGVDQAELRRYVTYWDAIDVPASRLIGIHDEAYDELASLGILSRSPAEPPGPVGISGGPDAMAQFFIAGQFYVLQQRLRQEPGSWSAVQPFANLVLPHNPSLAPTSTLEIEIANALPVPPPSVRFADILEFKRRRSPELLALRIRLDELYQDVLNARDVDRARITVHDKIAKALQDLDVVARESFGKRILSSLKAELSLSGVMTGAASGMYLAQLYGPIAGAIGAAGGALAGSIRFEASEARLPALPAGTTDFAYLSYVQKEWTDKVR